MIRTHKTLKRAPMNVKKIKLEKILKGIYKYHPLTNDFPS